MPLAKGVSHGTGLDQKQLDWEKHLEKLQKEFFQMKTGSEKYKKGSNRRESDKFSFSDRQVIDSGSVTVETNGFPRPRSRAGYISVGDNPLYVDTPDGGLKFHIEFEMDGYRPEEISVKTDGGTLFVQARHEEIKDGTRRTKSEYKRKVEVPPDVDPDTMRSYFTANGVLTIEAPVRQDYQATSGTARRARSPKTTARNRRVSSSTQDNIRKGWSSASDNKQWDTVERPASVARIESYPNYSQSLKRQTSVPRVNGSMPKYSQRESQDFTRSLPRRNYYASTSSLPMNTFSVFGRNSPLPTTQTESSSSYWNKSDDIERLSTQSTPAYYQGVSRGGSTGLLSIKTDNPPQRTRNYSESDSAPRSPAVLREVMNGDYDSGTSSPASMFNTSTSSQSHHSIMNEIPIHTTRGNYNDQVRAMNEQYSRSWSQDNDTSRGLPGRPSSTNPPPPSYRQSTSDLTDAGYLTGSPGTAASTNTLADFPSFRRNLFSVNETTIPENEIGVDSNRNKVDRRRTMFNFSPFEPQMRGGSYKKTRHSLGGEMLSNRDATPMTSEPRLHTPIIMNTGGGRKLRMVVDIGPPFTPENINVKSTSTKVIIEARKIVFDSDQRDRIGFKREVKLPEPIDPHTLKALFNDQGRLTLTASVKAT